MRIIPFPTRSEAGPNDAWHAELDAALGGEGEGSVADSWRELREDVRALAPPMAPEFERQLRERIAERGARRPREASPLEHAGASTAASPAPPAIPTNPAHRGSVPKRLRSRLGRLSRPPGLSGAAAGIATIGAVIVAVVVAGPWQAGTGPTGVSVPPQLAGSSNPGARTSMGTSGAAKGAAAQSTLSVPGGAASNAPAASGAAAASGRIQQLAASISLSAIPSEVQTVADRVARLAVSFGGFVQSSQVQVQHEGSSRGELDLRLPSAKLGGALASLGQLAPVLAESQSLQDITNTYDAARQRLSDATAERRALLRALAGATTEGQIDSLRERLSQARSAITQAQSALQAVSRRASTAEVEVTVLGDARTGSEGLTLHRGLHDAGRVLVVTLAVMLIAAAILLPLALLVLALATARRSWRRYQRERVLDPR
jgi:Domain of unknown function (DUF4349)